jgi:hypothetical protein
MKNKNTDSLLEKNKRQQTKKLDKKREKWGYKAEELNADEGASAAQAYIEKKEKKFHSKPTRSEKKAAQARDPGAETKSERIAGEVEDSLREPGGKKKPDYKKRKKQLKFGTGNHPLNR